MISIQTLRVATRKFGALNRCEKRTLTTKATIKETSLARSQLGKSDLVVSEACLGCMKFGTQNTEDESHHIMSAAYDRGINFFDTAEMYSVRPSADVVGKSSLILGSWLKKAQINREEVIIASKITGFELEESFGFIPAARVNSDGPADCRLDRKSIEAAVDTELHRLGIDYIDLMQTHWPDRYTPSFGNVEYLERYERESVPFEEQISTLHDLIKKGKIRHWGLSNETSYGTMMICFIADQINAPRPVSIQNSFSLIDRNFSVDLAEVCGKRQMNIPLLPWSAGAGGSLSGKYLNGRRPKGARMSDAVGRRSRWVSDRVLRAVEEYVKIADEFGVTPMQLAYLFCKAQPFVGSTIIAASSLEQLQENIDGFSKDLPEDALLAINAVHQQFPNPQNIY